MGRVEGRLSRKKEYFIILSFGLVMLNLLLFHFLSYALAISVFAVENLLWENMRNSGSEILRDRLIRQLNLNTRAHDNLDLETWNWFNLTGQEIVHCALSMIGISASQPLVTQNKKLFGERKQWLNLPNFSL